MKKIKNFTYTNYFIIDEIGRKLSIDEKLKRISTTMILIKSCDIGLSPIAIQNEIFAKYL